MKVWLRPREAQCSHQSLTCFSGRNPRNLSDREVKKPCALQEQLYSMLEDSWNQMGRYGSQLGRHWGEPGWGFSHSWNPFSIPRRFQKNSADTTQGKFYAEHFLKNTAFTWKNSQKPRKFKRPTSKKVLCNFLRYKTLLFILLIIPSFPLYPITLHLYFGIIQFW